MSSPASQRQSRGFINDRSARWARPAPARPRRLKIPLAGLLVSAALLLAVPAAHARRIETYSPGRARPPVTHTPAPKAKAEPPPAAKEAAPAASASEESSASAAPSSGDDITANGGGSPLCRDPGVLSSKVQRNCETSDFVAAPDPTGNYAFDVNINTGISKLSNDISTTIENFLQFAWMGLVALVHGLLVMFEWCYSLNLDGELMGEVSRGLHEAQQTFTKPWMAVVLAIASVLAAYHGLIRRRVAETLGQVLMMLAMMLGGLWVIVNPAGTIGALSGIANEASIGTLSAISTGNPNNAKLNLANSMQDVFSGVIAVPWCYMEFGNVGWCHQTKELDGKLASAAKKIAANEQSESKCSGMCSAGASPQSKQLAASAALLREARTNGELFLALPANEEQRNSVKTKGTLLAELCGSEESADKCTGPTKSQAEFRTQRGTGSRVTGLILIWLGALGMLLLLGFLVFRLLEAAIASLFYLLLAPVAVLAPALGDGGRSAFRGWASRLLGAVMSKLIYSFLLGVVLLMMNMLLGMKHLGWWAQWLLISALWWVAFHHRHKVLGFAHGSQNEYETRSMRWFYRVRMAQDLGRIAGWARHKLSPAPPTTQRRRPKPTAGGPKRPGGSNRPPGGGSGQKPPGAGGGGGGTPNRTGQETQKAGQETPRPEPERSTQQPQTPATERPLPQPATAHAEAGEGSQRQLDGIDARTRSPEQAPGSRQEDAERSSVTAVKDTAEQRAGSQSGAAAEADGAGRATKAAAKAATGKKAAADDPPARSRGAKEKEKEQHSTRAAQRPGATPKPPPDTKPTRADRVEEGRTGVGAQRTETVRGARGKPVSGESERSRAAPPAGAQLPIGRRLARKGSPRPANDRAARLRQLKPGHSPDREPPTRRDS